MTCLSIPHHSVFYQAIISSHSSFEIFHDLLLKYCQQFDGLTVMSLLYKFNSQDHAWTAGQAVSSMNHHFYLVLKAGQSRTDMVKSFKTTPLNWNSGASFGLTSFLQISLIIWTSLTEFLAMALHYTISLQQTVTYFVSLSFLTISYQLIFVFLGLKFIINLMVVQVNWRMIWLWVISNNNLTCLLDMISEIQLNISSPICLL